jgi:uncharacterized protein YfaS (alpha-2-macroglobulin family)
MLLENEILDFTNWLYDNGWELSSEGNYTNIQTDEVKSVGELIIKSETINDYVPQAFQVGNVVRDKNSGNDVELTKIDWNRYSREYQYWYEDEDGDEWYGYEDEFEKI